MRGQRAPKLTAFFRLRALAIVLSSAFALGGATPPPSSPAVPADARAIVIFRVDRAVVRERAVKRGGAAKHIRYVVARAQTTARVGDVIRTRAHSRAEIHLLGEGVFIRLKENSVLKISRARSGGGKPADVSLGLSAGRALVRVAKTLGFGARVRVRTPTAVAAVRGTVFAVEVDRAVRTDVKVLEGVVAASALSDGKEIATREVTAGREIAAREGGALSEPAAMSAQELAAETAWADEPEMEPVAPDESAGDDEQEGFDSAEPAGPEVIEPEPDPSESPEVEDAEPADGE